MSEPSVIDSSVGISWVHPDQATPESEQLLKDFEAGRTMIVPALWFPEVANSLLVLQRRKKITAADRKAALNTLGNLRLEVDDESIRAAFLKTSELAEKYMLTVYDATYLELALRRKAGLATRDQVLKNAARKCGLAVF